MNVWSTPNSVWDREYTVPSGGLAPSSRLMWRLYSQCGASVVALALLKTSAKSWYVVGTPAILGVSTGGEVAAEWSFASSVWISMGSNAAGAEAGVDLMEGGTRAAGIHSVLFQNSMWPNTQSINRL